MTSLSRRTLLLSAGAASAMTAVPERPRAAAASEIVDAIVIGAGLSGLGTARLLEQQGLKVRLLEGRKRVGGRIYTLADLPGHPEAGANTLGAGYGRTIDAARWAGVELEDVLPRLMLSGKQELVLGDRVIPPAEWPTSPLNPFPEGRKAIMPWEYVSRLIAERTPLKSYADWTAPASRSLDVPLHDFLSSQGADEATIRLAYDTIVNYGTSARDVSALMLEFIDGWIKSQSQAGHSQFAAKGGNQRIPEGMAAKLKSEILLDKTVVALEDDRRVVTVHCADGTRLRARRVVAALPFSTLRRLHIEPGLTGLQAKAVEQLRYQAVTLVFLTAKRPFWTEDGLSPSMWTDGLAQWVTAQHFGDSPAEITGLTVNARGLGATRLDRLGADAAGRQVVAAIEAIRPAAKGQLTVAGFHSWGLDPFSAGDWAVFGPGQPTGLLPVMAQNHGNIFFCGEHTATGNRGMEGALESAERVSVDLLQSI